MRKVFVVIAFLFCSNAFSEELTIFGFELGKPLNIPECEYTLSSGSIKLYDSPKQGVCFEGPHNIDGYNQPVKRIIFSDKTSPLIVANSSAIALEIDGNLAGLEFFTYGISAQDITLETLSKKYGKPTKKSAETIENNFGASVVSLTANWNLKKISITFEGVTDRLDRGHVIIDLHQARLLRKIWIKELLSERTKL